MCKQRTFALLDHILGIIKPHAQRQRYFPISRVWLAIMKPNCIIFLEIASDQLGASLLLALAVVHETMYRYPYQKE